MASYEDKYEKLRLDWAMPFQRTGDFPLDRTDLFSSYADAVKYAAGNIADPDERKLCGTSYIGQIITVYENDVISVYMINADRSLQPIGSAPVDGISIDLNENQQVCIKGFNDAPDGYMLIKDSETHQLKWVEPISREGIDAAVIKAETAANNARTQANIAKAKAEYVDRKIWFGSLAEYNNLETIYEDTIYIILDGVVKTNG